MINVQNLSFTYPGASEDTIKNLNFNIDKGEVFGFLGPSGAGKSTVQKIIIGLLKDYRGKVTVIDRELSSLGRDYYNRIGVAFELPNLYSKFTAFENLNFFGSLYSCPTLDAKELLKLVGLEEDVHTRVANFSKGMKMRLNFCRALLNNPDLLFLDEPTSGLDPTNAKNIKEIILTKKSEGKTVFLTTHNMNVAEDICDRVAFIVDGKIALVDSPRRLKINKGRRVVRVEYKDGSTVTRADFELEAIGQNENFLRLLRDKDIETIHTLEASLEDIFIDITGRSLS